VEEPDEIESETELVGAEAGAEGDTGEEAEHREEAADGDSGS